MHKIYNRCLWIDLCKIFIEEPIVVKGAMTFKLKDIARMNKAEFVHLQLKTKKQAGDIAGTKLKKFSNFKIAHIESALIIDDLRSQGLPLPEFVYYNGIMGPIKIWKVEYTGKEKIKQEYLDRDETKYLDWLL